MLVPREDLKTVVQGYSDCKDFSALCLKRNGLLEEYKKEADEVIAAQERKNLEYKEQIDADSRKRNILGPIAGLLLGIAGGIIYQQNQK